MNERFTIREAKPEDLAVVLYHRRSMFRDMGYGDEAARDAMEATSKPFFAKGLSTETYRGWLVENRDGNVIAGGGVIIFDYHSSPLDPSPKRPMIVNMYTEPAYRRQGLAGKLVHIMIDWCRREGFGSVLLHASTEGRSLYESLGFELTNEMRLMLR